MSSIVLPTTLGGFVLLTVIWLVAVAARAVFEEEAVGQVKRLARALIRRAARRLPEEERTLFVRDLIAELESRDLHDRPLSQLLMAFDVWIHSSDLRPHPRRVLRSAERTVTSLLVWLGGAEPDLLAQMPWKRPRFVVRGWLVGLIGLMGGGVVVSIAVEWLFLPLPVALLAGSIYGGIIVLLERVSLASARGPWRLSQLVPALAILAQKVMTGYVIATTILLRTFHPEILFPSQHLGNHHHAGLLEALSALRQAGESHPLLEVMQMVLTLFVVATASLPYGTALIESMNRSAKPRP